VAKATPLGALPTTAAGGGGLAEEVGFDSLKMAALQPLAPDADRQAINPISGCYQHRLNDTPQRAALAFHVSTPYWCAN